MFTLDVNMLAIEGAMFAQGARDVAYIDVTIFIKIFAYNLIVYATIIPNSNNEFLVLKILPYHTCYNSFYHRF